MKITSALLALALLPLAPAAFAQAPVQPDAERAAEPTPSFDERYSQARAKGIAGLSFTVDLGGKKQFHRGEVMPIGLRFSARPYNGYKLQPRAYDRSGRLNGLDFFIIDRAGDAPDPLAEHFREGLFMGGGLSAMPAPINATPQAIELTLNDYLRFDVPGRYRLFVISNRPFKADGPMFGGPPGSPQAVSEMVEFEILQGEEWAQDRSRQIEALLAQAPAPRAGASTWERQGKSAGLARELRFLDTPLSRRLMVRYYDSPLFPGAWEFHFGLLGSRDTSDAMRAIHEHIQSPDGAVATGLLRDLSELTARQSASTAPDVPPYPRQSKPDSVEMKSYWAARKVLDEWRGGIESRVQAEVAGALKLKRGRARAVTLSTLIERAGVGAGGFNVAPETPEFRALRRELVASWSALEQEKQRWLLSERWPLVRALALLPLLEKASDAPMIVNPNLGDNYEQREWKGLLLFRIGQLSPGEGRKYLLREMARHEPRTDIGALLDLPDETLPALDAVLLRNLRDNRKRYGSSQRVDQLIARYASPRIAPQIRAIVEREHASSLPLLAYLTRVQPAQAAAIIEKKLSGEYKEPLFGTIAAFTMNPVLEALCLKYLRGADRQLGADAARALSMAGSPRAEAALWARMEKWHAALRGKKLDQEQLMFEEELSRSLAQMPGPTLNAAARARLRELCISPQNRARFDEQRSSMHAGALPTILIRPAPTYFREGLWSLGYGPGFWSLRALERKLAQVPRGTTFGFRAEPFEAPADTQFQAARLQNWARAHGYKLKILKWREGA